MKNDLTALAEKIQNGQATDEEQMAFLAALNKEADDFLRILREIKEVISESNA